MLSSERVCQLMCDLYAEARFQFVLSHHEAVERAVRVMTATLRTINGGNLSITLSIEPPLNPPLQNGWQEFARVDIDASAEIGGDRKCHCGQAPVPEYDQPDCVPICGECLKDYMVGTPQEHATLKAMWQS